MKVTAVLGAMAKRFETGYRWKDSFESEVYKRAVDFGESVEEARKAREARCFIFTNPPELSNLYRIMTTQCCGFCHC